MVIQDYKIQMKWIICCTVLILTSTFQIDDQADFWHSIHEATGYWNQIEVAQPLGPCKPCKYRFQLYKEKIVFHISNLNSTNPPLISCTFDLYDLDLVNFVGKQYEIEQYCSKPLGKTQIKLERRAKAGLQWKYQLQAFDVGLFIKTSETQYTGFLIFMCFMINGIFLLLFPFQKKEIEKFQREVFGRISFFSLVFYLQLAMVIVTYETILLISYLYYQQTYTERLISYSLIGTCLLCSLVHVGYCFACLQRKVHELLPENTMKKYILNYSLILLGIIAYPFIICLFPKGLWFFFLSSVGIWYQFYHSVTISIYPYAQFIVLFMFNIMFMGILACLYPFGNFIELTPFNLVVLALYQISLYLGGSFFMQKKIKAEKLMKEAEESNYNKRELDSLGSTEIKSEETVK